MKEYQKQPENVSSTIQSKTKAANQASVEQILQDYRGKPAQLEELPKEDKLLQGKFEIAQREELDDDDELLQGKFETTQRQEAPNNTGLPDNLKAGVEQLSGLDMSDVKVHYNSSKPASVQAYAYTQGNDIHVAPRQEKHLAHEAWHVAQQKQGRVQPTTTVGGIAVNDNTGLENEADVMGGKALQMKQEENRSRVVGNDVAQKKASVPLGFGFVDKQPETVAQQKFQAIHNNRFVQRKTLIKNEGMECKYIKENKETSVIVGKKMEAWLDPQNMYGGQIADINTSQDDLMSWIKHIFPKAIGQFSVKGHLLNDNLGGTALGNNLYPISKGANGKHLFTAENYVKQAMSENKCVMYSVEVEGSDNYTKANDSNSKATFHTKVSPWNKVSNEVGPTKYTANIVSDLGVPKSRIAKDAKADDLINISGYGLNNFQKPAIAVKELTEDEKRMRKNQPKSSIRGEEFREEEQGEQNAKSDAKEHSIENMKNLLKLDPMHFVEQYITDECREIIERVKNKNLEKHEGWNLSETIFIERLPNSDLIKLSLELKLAIKMAYMNYFIQETNE